MLLAVLLLHLAVGLVLLRTQVVAPPRTLATRTELRLILPKAPRPPPRPQAADGLRERVRAPARVSAPERPPRQAGPTAITPPAAAASAAAPVAVAPAAAVAPLDLRLPGRGPVTGPVSGSGSGSGSSMAEQMRHDPRANSARETAEERMAAALGGRTPEVIEDVQGGRMIRGPNGECTLIRPSMMQEVDPTNERHRWLPGKASDCSQLQKGARRHKRPGSE